jgi:hypothetical protein
MDEAGKALTDALEQVVDLVLTHFNESTMAAARRWDGLIA